METTVLPPIYLTRTGGRHGIQNSIEFSMLDHAHRIDILLSVSTDGKFKAKSIFDEYEEYFDDEVPAEMLAEQLRCELEHGFTITTKERFESWYRLVQKQPAEIMASLEKLWAKKEAAIEKAA